MAGGESIRGAEDFLKLSKALKAAGQKELRNELHKAMKATAKPLLPKVRQSARDSLPKRGGLNERIAKKPYRTQVRTGAATAGVRIVGAKVDPRINQGRLVHPIFGRKGKPKPGQANTAIQAVKPGYFDEPLKESGPAVREDLIKALETFAATLIKEV